MALDIGSKIGGYIKPVTSQIESLHDQGLLKWIMWALLVFVLYWVIFRG